MNNSKPGKPVDTASELYREMKRRGLELRAGSGRDDLLLQQLAGELRCVPTKLQAFLDASTLSAEDFLQVFLKVSAPFALMFQEIWDYLAARRVSRAMETLSVRFGFPDSPDKQVLDLERFRRYIEMTKVIAAPVRLWPSDALHALFEMSRVLLKHIGWNSSLNRDYGHYCPGEPFQLPPLPASAHGVDRVVGAVRSLFQTIIDEYAEQSRSRERQLPELNQDSEVNEGNLSVRRAAQMLTDLLPAWIRIFVLLERIDGLTKDEALAFYETTIEPLLGAESRMTMVSVREALDILDLPFWRHRWHTYEVWATVLTLRNLDEYRPVLRITDGYVPVDGYSAGVIADLTAQGFPSVCVAVQVETPFRSGKRRAIKPDLRVCFADTLDANDTAAVVEFKQRKKLDRGHVVEVLRSYSDGSPCVGGVFMLNYDPCDQSIPTPPGCYLLGDVYPGNRSQTELYRADLANALRSVGLIPERDVVVLLDVSSSMGSQYAAPDVQTALRTILGFGWVKCLRFNYGLVPGGDLEANECINIQTTGLTELAKALDQIEQLYGFPRKLLVVTDGGFSDDPREKLASIPEMKVCLPHELPGLIQKFLA